MDQRVLGGSAVTAGTADPGRQPRFAGRRRGRRPGWPVPRL